MADDRLYFDYAASAPLLPEAAMAMTAAAAAIGNPSAIHAEGRGLRLRLDAARESVARLLAVDAAEIYFTSGATEALNWAVTGILAAMRRQSPGRPLRVLTTPLEHAAVAEPLRLEAERRGVAVDLLPVGANGLVSPADVASRVTDDTVLVCVIWANNVIGTIQPIAEIGRRVSLICETRGRRGRPLLFLSDAVQAVVTQPVEPRRCGIDALALSGHKFGGPKGSGVLYLRRGVPCDSLIEGGGQEAGRRSGTENMPGICGLGAAADRLAVDRSAEAARLLTLKRLLLTELERAGCRCRLVGEIEFVLPQTAYLTFPNCTGDELALRLDAAGFAAASGSACDAGQRRAPAAIQAVLGEAAARHGGLRLSFGRLTTAEDVKRLAAAIGRTIK